MNLANKNIVITGAGRGIGRVIANKLAAEGACLMLVARTAVELNATLQQILTSSPESSSYSLDISDSANVEITFKSIYAKYGRIDCLVNNAGIQPPIGSFANLNLVEWKKNVEINLFGAVNCSHAVLQDMIQRQKGKIINLSGGGATAARPNFSAYAVAKTGLVRFTETLAEEVKAFHIAVNAIAPGAISTKMLDEILKAQDNAGAEYQDALKRKQTGGMNPQMAAELVCFLCSDESDGITGKLISAPWDPWQTEEFQHRLRNDKDLNTLRRIDDKFFLKKL